MSAVLATVKVGPVSPPGTQEKSVYRTVPGHVDLVVLRCFPPSAMKADEHIHLDYQTLAAGNSGMNGPDVAYFKEGMVLIVPLKSNPRPAIHGWRLFADTGGGIVIPAIEKKPAHLDRARDAREYLLQEIASRPRQWDAGRSVGGSLVSVGTENQRFCRGIDAIVNSLSGCRQRTMGANCDITHQCPWRSAANDRRF